MDFLYPAALFCSQTARPKSGEFEYNKANESFSPSSVTRRNRNPSKRDLAGKVNFQSSIKWIYLLWGYLVDLRNTFVTLPSRFKHMKTLDTLWTFEGWIKANQCSTKDNSRSSGQPRDEISVMKLQSIVLTIGRKPRVSIPHKPIFNSSLLEHGRYTL